MGVSKKKDLDTVHSCQLPAAKHGGHWLPTSAQIIWWKKIPLQIYAWLQKEIWSINDAKHWTEKGFVDLISSIHLFIRFHKKMIDSSFWSLQVKQMHQHKLRKKRSNDSIASICMWKEHCNLDHHQLELYKGLIDLQNNVHNVIMCIQFSWHRFDRWKTVNLSGLAWQLVAPNEFKRIHWPSSSHSHPLRSAALLSLSSDGVWTSSLPSSDATPKFDCAASLSLSSGGVWTSSTLPSSDDATPKFDWTSDSPPTFMDMAGRIISIKSAASSKNLMVIRVQSGESKKSCTFGVNSRSCCM